MKSLTWSSPRAWPVSWRATEGRWICPLVKLLLNDQSSSSSKWVPPSLGRNAWPMTFPIQTINWLISEWYYYTCRYMKIMENQIIFGFDIFCIRLISAIFESDTYGGEWEVVWRHILSPLRVLSPATIYPCNKAQAYLFIVAGVTGVRPVLGSEL